MKSSFLIAASAIAAIMTAAAPVSAQVATGQMGALTPDQQQFFGLYKELIETNTPCCRMTGAG